MATGQAAYRDRIAFLREASRDEGIALNPASFGDFGRFVDSGERSRAGLVLTDDDNLRAVWKHSNPRVGLEFMGEGEIRYVALRWEEGDETRARIARSDGVDLDDMEDRLAAIGLGGFLRGPQPAPDAPGDGPSLP